MDNGKAHMNDFQYLINDIDIYFLDENMDIFDYKNLITFEISFITFLCALLFLF